MDLLQVVPSTDKTRTANSVRAQKVAPANIAILPLSNAERYKVVDHAATKDPITRSAQASKAKTRSHLRPHRRLRTDKVRNTGVVQEVQAPNASECLRDDVCQDAAPALCVHWLELRRDVPHLHDAVDPDENVGRLERLAVPEEHPRADADVADGVVGDELDDLVELFLLRWVVGAVFPELVEPCELETSRVLVYGL
jgi:molybdenum cofactor biosynthesis enzyme MoaA